MDKDILQALKAKVEIGEDLQRQIAALDDFIASCNGDIGFVNILMNFKQQNEIVLATVFPAKTLFTEFKAELKDAAYLLKAKLETEFKNLN